MKIIADTNVLVRAFVDDNPAQSRDARASLLGAEAVVVGKHALCELAWVLASSFGFPKLQIANVIRELRDKSNVITDRAAIDAGLAVMDAGGDFADGVIDYEGRWLGGRRLFRSIGKRSRRLPSRG